MKLVFDHQDVLADGIVELWFKPERPLRYNAGQYAEVYLPHNADNRGTKRWFTLSSSPNDALISITTKFPTRPSSYKRQLQALNPGDRLDIDTPLGDFVLPKDTTIPLLLIAVGTGCAPYVSMIRWLQDRQESRTIQLLYAARRPRDLVFSDLWEDYPLSYRPLVSQPTKAWSGKSGRLESRSIIELIKEDERILTYLAGPQIIVEPLFNELLKADIHRSQLLLDYFPGY